MADSSLGGIAYYSIVGAAGGVTLGALTDTIFNRFMPATNAGTDYAFLMYLGEEGAQILVGAWVADLFLSTMAGRGEDLAASVLGTAPFWFFFLGAQPSLAARTASLVLLLKNFVMSALQGSYYTPITPIPSGVKGSSGPSPTGMLVTPTSRENDSIGYSKQSLANDYAYPHYN